MAGLTMRLGIGLALALGALAGGASAAAEDPITVVRVPLEPEPADLNGGLASTSAPLHLPGTVEVVGARLVLGYANALAVEPEGSSLRLSANGEPLADLPLVASQGVVQAEVDVPPALFHAGANLLAFRVVLDCTRAAFEGALDPDRRRELLSRARAGCASRGACARRPRFGARGVVL